MGAMGLAALCEGGGVARAVWRGWGAGSAQPLAEWGFTCPLSCCPRCWGAVAEPGARGMSATPDERHGFLESFTTLLLRVRPDKWNKFVGSEEAMAVLDEFFRQQDVLELVLGLNPAGQLSPTTRFPPTLRGKGVYFVKKKRENITQENCQSGLLVGDISPSPVEQLITVVEEVSCPHGQAPGAGLGQVGQAKLPAHAAAAWTSAVGCCSQNFRWAQKETKSN